MASVGVNLLRNMVAVWMSVVLLALFRNAECFYNPSVCSIQETSEGLIPPPLPENFELKAEEVDHLHNFSVYQEVSFDHTNSRAKVQYLIDTIEFHSLYDFQTQQVVQWSRVHPGVTIERDPLSSECTAVDMKASPNAFLFGNKYKQDRSSQFKILTSNQVLRYGGPYLYAANGTQKDPYRGLQTNAFLGCIYDDAINTTTISRYYFADTDTVQPSGGTSAAIVTGEDDKPLSVPVKLSMIGSQSVGDKEVPINKTINISWFKGNPIFQPQAFQIPPWIHCDKYKGRKEKPQLPKAFSTRVSIKGFMVDILGQLEAQTSVESYEEIFYDYNARLARRDFTPNQFFDTDIYSKFGSYSPVSMIFDFNEGIRYTINKHSGRCFTTPIMNNEYFDSEEESLFRKLATPEEFFLMQMEDMEYKGELVARDIACDVWNGKHFHKQYNATFVKETYFSTEGWELQVDGTKEFHIPVRNVIIKKELDGELLEGIGTYDFFKFTKKPPPLSSFAIQSCVDQIDHRRFAIELMVNGDVKDDLFKYRAFFLEAAQSFLTNKTAINTPLRLQRLHLRQLSVSDSRTFFVFSLLDKVKLKNPMPQSGADLQDATVLLQRLVEAGNFTVSFQTPKGAVVEVTAGKSVLYTLTAGGGLTPAPLKPAVYRDENDDEKVQSDDNTEENTEVEEHKGMTSGHLALLSIAMLCVGIGIGIAIMYCYQKYYYSEDYVENALRMTTTDAAH